MPAAARDRPGRTAEATARHGAPPERKPTRREARTHLPATSRRLRPGLRLPSGTHGDRSGAGRVGSADRRADRRPRHGRRRDPRRGGPRRRRPPRGVPPLRRAAPGGRHRHGRRSQLVVPRSGRRRSTCSRPGGRRHRPAARRRSTRSSSPPTTCCRATRPSSGCSGWPGSIRTTLLGAADGGGRRRGGAATGDGDGRATPQQAATVGELEAARAHAEVGAPLPQPLPRRSRWSAGSTLPVGAVVGLNTLGAAGAVGLIGVSLASRRDAWPTSASWPTPSSTRTNWSRRPVVRTTRACAGSTRTARRRRGPLHAHGGGRALPAGGAGLAGPGRQRPAPWVLGEASASPHGRAAGRGRPAGPDRAAAADTARSAALIAGLTDRVADNRSATEGGSPCRS